jgi:hypothetical protein
MNRMAQFACEIALLLLAAGTVLVGTLYGEERSGPFRAGMTGDHVASAVAACDFLPNGRPPFSFVYGGKRSDLLLPTWRKQEIPGTSSNGNTRVVTWTDPQTGLRVTATVTRYCDFPATEWVVRFENAGKADTPILENILALDMLVDAPAAEPVVLRTITGSTATWTRE